MSSIAASAPASGKALGHYPALRKALLYAALALLFAIYLLPFVRVLTGTVDEGVFLYGAQAVTWGAIPSRDFVEPQGPGSFYWLAMFFKLFGTSLFTARAVLLLTGVATALLTFHLARRTGAVGIFPAVFVLATSVPMMVMNSPHYDSNLFALLSFAVFLWAERKSSLALLFLSGALSGATTCFLQQKGLYLALSLALTLLILHRKPSLRSIASLLGGYCSVFLIELALYAAAGALPDLLYANFIWPLSVYQEVNASPYGYPLWQVLEPAWSSDLKAQFSTLLAFARTGAIAAPYLLILALPLLLPLLGLFSKRTAFRRELLPYWMAGYALFASELQRFDLGHLRNGCLILVILFFTLCETAPARFPKYLAFAITACLVLDAVGNLLSANTVQTPVHSQRGTLYARQHDTALDFLLAHAKPGDNVFIYPYQPIYYFLADLRNPTRYSYLIYRFNTNTQFREAVEDLKRKKVRYVLWNTALSGPGMTAIFPAYRLPPPGELIMEPYLENHYRPIAFENGFTILERVN